MESLRDRRASTGWLALTATAALVAGLQAPASAATTETVREADVTRQAEGTQPTDSWVIYTRAGTPDTAAQFVEGPAGQPLGAGSLQLTTVDGSQKVFAINTDHEGTSLGAVDDISYSTHRTAGALQQATSLNVTIDFNGPATGGFSTLVFEPVYNTEQGPVASGVWQDWIADGSGRWWSTRAINKQCAGATIACLRTWDDIVAANPDAVVGAVGVNQGSGNPGLISSVDALTFDETTYDFEPGVADSDGDGLPDDQDTDSKADCKDGGWMRFTQPTFRNQGDCVSHHARKR